MIQMAEIEIFSYCNRQCWFCPNSIIDRHSENIYMPEKLYLDILTQLAAINKRIKISYQRYNEPLSDPIVFKKRLQQAREILPESTLHVNTNGDYLTKEYLSELCDAGLNSLSIQSYLDINEPFDKTKLKNRILKQAHALGLDCIMEIDTQDFYCFLCPHESMEIRIRAKDFKNIGSTRGNSISTIKPHIRHGPCTRPKKFIYIDFNGSMMPCCNLRSDFNEHRKFIMGNLNENTIAEIFCSEKYKQLRKILSKSNIDMMPCRECSFLD